MTVEHLTVGEHYITFKKLGFKRGLRVANIVKDRPAQVLRVVAVGVERAVRLFARADARRGRTEHERDAVGAVMRARGARGVDETVRLQPEPGETVVAAFPVREFRRQRRILEPRDAADEAVQRRGAEVVAAEAGTARTERVQQRGAAAARRARGGMGGDAQGWDRGGHEREHGFGFGPQYAGRARCSAIRRSFF